MIVCVCRKVSDRQIREAAENGAQSLECLQFELGVATQCGRCADCATQVLTDARQRDACAADLRGAAAVHPVMLVRRQEPALA